VADLKRRLRKLEAARIKELEQAVEEFLFMVIDSSKRIAPDRRTSIADELEKMCKCSGNYQPREPQGLKQHEIEAIEAIQGILTIIGDVDSELKDMVIKRLNEKVGTYDIYGDALRGFPKLVEVIS